MRITAIVEDRVISAEVDGTQVVGGGNDKLAYTLDAEWGEKDHLCIWFSNGEHPEVLTITGTSGEVAIPPCVPGSLRLTFDGWNDGDETHLLTERMFPGIRIDRHGQHTFGCMEDEANRTIEKLVKATEEADRATQESREQVADAIEAERDRESEFSEAQQERQEAFQGAQSARETAFAAGMAGYTQQVNAEAQKATQAAQAANNAADSLAQRVQAGEFNGAPFSIKFTPGSIAAMNALTSMKKGDFACIQSSISDPDNAKLFLYDGREWNFMTDLSGAIGLTGPQGVQGVSLKNVEVRGMTQVWVTQYDPSTQQDRTYMVGDFENPLLLAVDAAVKRNWEIMDKSEYDALTEYEVNKLYMVRW